MARTSRSRISKRNRASMGIHPHRSEENTRLRYENAAFLALSERIYAYVEKEYRRTKPSPRGEGGEQSEPDRVLAA